MMFIFWQVAGGNGGERVVTDSKDDREKGVAWVAWKKFGLRKKNPFHHVPSQYLNAITDINLGKL